MIILNVKERVVIKKTLFSIAGLIIGSIIAIIVGGVLIGTPNPLITAVVACISAAIGWKIASK